MSKVRRELDGFRQNRSGYLTELLAAGEEHRLFSFPVHGYTDTVRNDEFRDYVVATYHKTFERIYHTQIKRNLKNARLPFGKLLRNIRDGKCVKGLLAGYKNLVFDKDLFDRITRQYDAFKSDRSFRTIADLSVDWIEKNKDDTTPWMAYVHVDDAHFPEIFFTYDTDRKEILEEEFGKINHYLDRLPESYCGSISCDLSLLYCDSVIERMFRYLDGAGLLDHTSVVITADHGFSYYFNPIREKYVISSYKENYNVPFLVYDRDLAHKKIPGYLATKDIPATLLDLAGIEAPAYFKGHSLLNFEGREYATLEYMGGGCPDLRRRPVQLGIRNDRCEVMTEIFQNSMTVKEVYDMKKDPLEHHNLAEKKDLPIGEELEMLQRRYREIMSEVDE